MKCRKCRKEIPNGSLFCCWCGMRQQIGRKLRSNGEGTVFMTRTGKWKAEISAFRDGKRYCVSKGGFNSKREAVDALPELRQKLIKKVGSAGSATVQELYDFLCEHWLSTLCSEKQGSYRTAWARLEPIHNARIAALRYSDLQALIDACDGGYYPKQNMKILLRHLYDLALKYEYVERDYSVLLDVPPQKPSTRTSLTSEEVHRMWKDYEDGHTNVRYFLIMVYTGMRTGEMLTIRKQNVRLKEQYCTGGIKTEAGKAREIVFCDKIMPLVLDAYHSGETRLCELNEKVFYKEWHDMAERIGLKPDMTPYCCRHSTPTMLAEEGVQPAIIQQIMGHSNYSMTANHYTHISLDAKIDALNKLK